MFTLLEIETAHSKVKTGADFPHYIQEIKALGVTSFETWVLDSHTNYFGNDDETICSDSQYNELTISDVVDQLKFIDYLKSHQKGETDYYTFCTHCAETGIVKWIVSLQDYSCIYYDKNNQVVLKEEIPH